MRWKRLYNALIAAFMLAGPVRAGAEEERLPDRLGAAGAGVKEKKDLMTRELPREGITQHKEETAMKKLLFVLVLGVTLVFGTQVLAAETLVDSVTKGCKTELETYCKNVTPGEGRLLACLYAHEDKLSGQCEYALYDAVAQLERALTALSYVANECRNDLQKFCSDIQPGQGRLLACIEKNEKQVSGRCKQAMKEVGLKK